MGGGSIDWAATGSMLQGVGTLTGAVAVIVAAIVGRSTFTNWRRQKSEERRIDLAEQVLTVCYKVKRAFSIIRSPSRGLEESNRAEAKLKEIGTWNDHTRPEEVGDLLIAQTIMTRSFEQRLVFDELLGIMPITKAIFGDKIEAALEALLVKKAFVTNVAALYPRSARQLNLLLPEGEAELERRRANEDVFWEGNGDPDPVALSINETIALLEQRLLPIIRNDTPERRKPWWDVFA